MAVHNRFGGGVPRWVCDLLCETCPLCVQKLTRKARSAGHMFIITKGLVWLAWAGAKILALISSRESRFTWMCCLR
eukprot:6207671-Pleurochrysis_carterae.AAC.1